MAALASVGGVAAGGTAGGGGGAAGAEDPPPISPKLNVLATLDKQPISISYLQTIFMLQFNGTKPFEKLTQPCGIITKEVMRINLCNAHFF
jgi:hypothetical protein